MTEPLFIETMRACSGRILNADEHLRRMARTMREAYGLDLADDPIGALTVPPEADKCRMVYGRTIVSVEFSAYQPREIRSLRLVEAPDTLDYHLKYADRSALNALLELRDGADDILIVRRGCITDTSFTNVVFDDGHSLLTPAEPLLPGTMRASLLASGLIRPARITPADLPRFRHIHLINALRPLSPDPSPCHLL